VLPEIYDPRQVSLPMEPATFLTLTPRRTAYPVLSEKLWNFSRLPGFIQMVTDFQVCQQFIYAPLQNAGTLMVTGRTF
jgi:hypothetical protein